MSYLANGFNYAGFIAKLGPDGTILGTFPLGQPGAGPIAIDSHGHIWEAVSNGSPTSFVTEWSAAGTVLGTFPVNGAGAAIAIAGSGDIWVLGGPYLPPLFENVTKLRGDPGAPSGLTLATTTLPDSTTAASVHYDGTGTGSGLVCASAPNVTQVCATIAPLGTVVTSPAALEFIQVGQALGFTASQSGYAGSFSVGSTSCTSGGTTVATVSPASGSGDFTVTAVAIGTCSITVSGGNGGTTSVSVGVTTAHLAISGRQR